MLPTELAIDKYFDETINNWAETRVIKIGSIGNQIALNIQKSLQDKVPYQLTKLNKIWEDAPKEDLFMNPDGGITRLTKLLYETNLEFKKLYKLLCSNLLKEFGGNKAIQRQPTIRVYASSKINDFCPNWHTDLSLGHPVGTLNIWIPLTDPHLDQFNGFNICEPDFSKKFYFDMRKQSTPYQFVENQNIVKSEILMKNSSEVKASVGEALVFDSRCFHSAVPIKNHSRVSMDIRIIDMKYLQYPYPPFKGFGRKKAIFDLENYYMKI